jgi:hypothetical protein
MITLIYLLLVNFALFAVIVVNCVWLVKQMMMIIINGNNNNNNMLYF